MMTDNNNNNNNTETPQTNNNDEWKEIKGPDLMLKIISGGGDAKQQKHETTKSSSDDYNNDYDDNGGPRRKIKSGDTVLMDLIGRQADHPDHLDGNIFQDVKGWLVTVGEPYCLIRALDDTISHLREGETALIYSSCQYYYPGISSSSSSDDDDGTTNNNNKFLRTYKGYSLPADSNMIFELTVTKFVMDTSRLNPYFPIQRSLTMKNIANDIYLYEWIAGGQSRERSIKLYEKSARQMKSLLNGTYFASVEPDHPQRKQCQTLLVDNLNNVVVVYMRAKRWSKARESALMVLKEDPKNSKAVFRYAKSSMMDSELSLQEQDDALKKAENIIVYKDKEEPELKKLRTQWKKKDMNN